MNLTISEIIRPIRKPQDMESATQQRVHAANARKSFESTLVRSSQAGAVP